MFFRFNAKLAACCKKFAEDVAEQKYGKTME